MLVIFDCDGVLVDSEAIYCAVDAEALTRLGHPTTTADIARRFSGVPHRVAWETLSAEIGFAQPADWVANILAECDRRMQSRLEAIADAGATLLRLTDAGHAICVASSSGKPTLEANLERTGLLDLLKPNIFSVSQVKRPKPAPDVFLFAAAQMGFDPADCLVVEDSAAGVTAARRAGIAVCGFVGGGHAYEELPERLIAAGAIEVCGSMPEVLAFITAQATTAR